MPQATTFASERSGADPARTLFGSFFMGGFECSTHRIRRGRLDMLEATGHDRHAHADYARLADMGVGAARSGVRWHRVESTPGRYDFRCDLPMIRAARATGVTTIWDLCHFGWPDHVDVWSVAFADRFARFARHAADVICSETDGPAFFSPINEISFTAWAGGDVGYLLPFGRGRGDMLKAQLVRAAIAAIEAIREVAPGTRFVHVDPVLHIVADPSRPEDLPAAEAHAEAQFHAWDMIAGRRHPELGGHPDYLDIVGVNFYHNNQWVHEGATLWRDDPLFRPFHTLLREVHARYGRPLFVAETGAESYMRGEWLSYIGREVRIARSAGVPVAAICWYPILDHPGWDDDRHCPNGLWGYPDDTGGRPLCRPLAAEIARQRALFSEGDLARVAR